jgi:hypothetical protein
VRDILKDQFAIVPSFIAGKEDDIDKSFLQGIEKEKEANRRSRFDDTYKLILTNWNNFTSQPWFSGFGIIRNKLTSHLEVKKIEDCYKITDVSDLGIKWSDLGTAVDLLEPIVLDINLIVRNTSFLNDKEFLDKASEAFWE